MYESNRGTLAALALLFGIGACGGNPPPVPMVATRVGEWFAIRTGRWLNRT